MARKKRVEPYPPGAMIFHDGFDVAAKHLDDQQLGLLFRAIMQHHKGEDPPELDHDTSIAFDFMINGTDKAAESYFECSRNGTYGGFTTACKNAGVTPPRRDEWEALGRPSFKEWHKDP